MSLWSVGWIVWGSLFAVLEGTGIFYNIRNGKGFAMRTLTQNLRWIFATAPGGSHYPWHTFRRVLLLAAVAWLGVHLAVPNWVG